jgi:signal transduction histidine kinase
MRFKAHRASLTLLLIGVLVALLGLLAVLQYKWLGQISVAERQTMQTNLRTQGRALQEEINKEIELASSRVRMSLADYRKDSWGELIERYSRWKANTAYPGLIKSVYLARADGDGQFNLTLLDESAKRLEPAGWPDSFADIRKRFAPMRRSYGYAAERREMERREGDRSIGSLIEHGYIAEDIPAMVRFLVEFERMQEPKNTAERDRVRTETIEAIQQSPLAIMVLDLDYLRQFFIPALFKRRFTVDGSLDYDLAFVYRKAADEKSEKAASGSDDAHSPSSDLAINMFLGSSSAELNHGPRWQVVINHRAGSLDAAVAQARGRNLVVSFGILSLLALSTIIIIIISRRAQRLARKQIDFVAGVSHEFRTPLAVIHAVSENLADGLITDKQQVEECGAVIRNDTRRLAGMVEQVLEFAGANRGKSLYQAQPVDVTGVIEDVLARYSAVEPEKDLRVEKEFEPNLPAVLVDLAALECAVRNIIDNAVKYGRGRTCWIGITARTQGTDHARNVELTIADKGIGIQPAEIDQIFEPFYRGTDVIAAQIHGNGLGLSLVRNAIEANGGTITVASTLGEGSSFTLRLPVVNGNRQLIKEDA